MKRLVVLIIVVLLSVNMSLVTYADDLETVPSNSQKLILPCDVEMCKNMLGDNKNYNNISLSMNMFNGPNETTASGYLQDGEILVEFTANGKLSDYKVDSKVMQYGVMHGKTSDNDSITLTISSIPNENKYLVYVSLGSITIDENKNIISNNLNNFIFGEYYDEMSELSDIITSEKVTVKNIETNNLISNAATIEKPNVASTYRLANCYYNIAYRSCGMNGFKYNNDDSLYPLGVISLYTPKAMEPGKINDFAVKVNSYTNNAVAFLKANGYIGITEAWVEYGECTIFSNDKNINFFDPDPESASALKTIEFNVPISVSGSFSWKCLSLTIPLSFRGITASRSKINGASQYNKITWEHDIRKNIDIPSGKNYKNTSSGYTGKCLGTYMKYDQSKSIDVIGEGSICYSFRNYAFNKEVLGSFDVNLSTSTQVKITPN